MADSEQFTLKSKPITYTKAFVKLYNWRNRKQVHEIYEIIELEKMHVLTSKNPCNLGIHQIIKILSILYSIYVVFRNQNKFMSYVNNYIDWD